MRTKIVVSCLAFAWLSTTVSCQGPAAVPAQGLLAGLDPNAATFKEEDYVDAMTERRRYTDVSDFINDFPNQEGAETRGIGGGTRLITVDQKPSLLRSGGLAQQHFSLLPCGLNVPHLHPRGSKTLYVLEGVVSAGFVEEGPAASARVFAANLTKGQSLTIPQGLAMWVHNLNCSSAEYLDVWSNADPGILSMVPAILKMPIATIAAAFGTDTGSAADMAQRSISSIPQGPQECLERCNVVASSPENSAASAPDKSIITVTEPSSGAIATATFG